MALVAAVLLPALAFGAAASWAALRSYDAAAEARLLDTAQAIARTIDSEISAYIAALRVLATSRDLRAGGDLAAFDSLARATGTAFGGWVVVRGRDGRAMIHTYAPPGAPLPGPGGAIGPGGGGVAVERVFASGRPTVSDLAVGRLYRHPSLFVFAPVMDGSVRYAIGMSLLPERLSALLAGQAASGGGAATLTDRRGAIIARSRDAERVLGQLRPYRSDGEPRRQKGLLSGHSLDGGTPIRIAYHGISTAPGWTIWVTEPEASFAAARRGPLLAMLGGGGLAVLVGLALTAGLVRRVLRPVKALVRHADAVVTGRLPDQPAPVARIPIAEFETLRVATARAAAALRDSDTRLRLAIESAHLGTWEVDHRNGTVIHSARTLEIFGYEAETGLVQDCRANIHPEDRDRFEAAIEQMHAGRAESFHVQYRFERPDGSWRWVESHGRAVERDPVTGMLLRLTGTTLDVTERKAAEERQVLLIRELDHRAKNTLAIVQATLRLTPRQDTEAYARAVEGRVHALARAHTLLSRGRWTSTDLRALIAGELDPFLASNDDAASPQAELDGPQVALGASAVQALSMAMHELATNAVKHGSLSLPTGRVSVTWGIDRAAGMLRLRWSERGGPVLAGKPARRGVGSRVIEAIIQGQLGGRIEQQWEPGGLVCDIVAPLARCLPLKERAAVPGSADVALDVST